MWISFWGAGHPPARAPAAVPPPWRRAVPSSCATLTWSRSTLWRHWQVAWPSKAKKVPPRRSISWQTNRTSRNRGRISSFMEDANAAMVLWSAGWAQARAIKTTFSYQAGSIFRQEMSPRARVGGGHRRRLWSCKYCRQAWSTPMICPWKIPSSRNLSIWRHLSPNSMRAAAIWFIQPC